MLVELVFLNFLPPIRKKPQISHNEDLISSMANCLNHTTQRIETEEAEQPQSLRDYRARPSVPSAVPMFSSS